jgi:hypothetical protein
MAFPVLLTPVPPLQKDPEKRTGVKAPPLGLRPPIARPHDDQRRYDHRGTEANGAGYCTRPFSAD